MSHEARMAELLAKRFAPFTRAVRVNAGCESHAHFADHCLARLPYSGVRFTHESGLTALEPDAPPTVADDGLRRFTLRQDGRLRRAQVREPVRAGPATSTVSEF